MLFWILPLLAQVMLCCFFGTIAVVLDVDVVGAQMSAAAGVFLLFLHETQCFSVVSLAMNIRTRVFALEGYE